MKNLIVLVLALVACGNDNRGTQKATDKQTKDVKNIVQKYAFEAYPMWSQAHPEKACPAKLAELDEYMNERDAKDPWGNAYVMYCGQNLPAGAKGVAISSNGPDGKPGTDDDIKSW